MSNKTIQSILEKEEYFLKTPCIEKIEEITAVIISPDSEFDEAAGYLSRHIYAPYESIELENSSRFFDYISERNPKITIRVFSDKHWRRKIIMEEI